MLHHYSIFFNHLVGKYGKILDLGCGNGDLIAKLKTKAGKLYGYDVDGEKIRNASKRYPFIDFTLGRVGVKSPYKDSFFDIIILFHVLEHVDSEERLVEEVYRILKKGGKLFIASPYSGLFSFADAANIRYRFPRVHQLLVEFILGREKYKQEFIEKEKILMFGDSSINRSWHKHYKEQEIRALLIDKFVIEKFIKFSFFLPVILLIYNCWNFILNRNNRFLNYLIWLDNKLRMGEYSDNFFCLATKKTK